jgi:probable selenium-dependent hydroxylase accessory protein YqeC
VSGEGAGLLDPLGVRRGDLVAVAGAGGKTTLVYRLAGEAHARGWSVLVTTTTHMGGLPGADIGPVLVEAEDKEPRGRALEEALAREGRATLLGRRVRDDKLEGVSPERVDHLRSLADLVVVEADGARGRSLKVPADHEPVVPATTTLLVVVAALDVLGRPLTADWVHRLDLMLAMTGRSPGEIVNEDVVIAALGHPRGYLSRRPPAARSVLFLNKAESDGAFGSAARIAEGVSPLFGRIAAGSGRAGVARLLASAQDPIVH